MLDKFLDHISRCVEHFKSQDYKSIILMHHNDADGLSAGAILSATLSRAGYRLHAFCLEKPYPNILEKISQIHEPLGNKAVIFTDFGSGMLSQIAEIFKEARDVYILDHHGQQEIKSEQVKNLKVINCRSFGVDGSTSCSASVVCSLFALAFNSENEDLIPLGILGALGDGQKLAREESLEPSSDKSANQYICALGESRGLLTYNSVWSGRVGGIDSDLCMLVPSVNLLGSYDYLASGADVALKILRDGMDERAKKYVENLVKKYEAEMSAFLAAIRLDSGRNVTSFSMDGFFENSGVKMVGLMCEELINRNLVELFHIIVGFQEIPDRIPGLGSCAFNQVKVSLRLSENLVNQFKKNHREGLDIIVPKLGKSLDAFVDACHFHAAALVIRPEQRKSLLDKLEELISPARTISADPTKLLT